MVHDLLRTATLPFAAHTFTMLALHFLVLLGICGERAGALVFLLYKPPRKAAAQSVAVLMREAAHRSGEAVTQHAVTIILGGLVTHRRRQTPYRLRRSQPEL